MKGAVRGLRWWFAALAIVAVAAIGVLATPLLVRGAVGWLDVGTTPAPCDYVMVLGGNANTRALVAATLVRLGLGRTVLVPRMSRPRSEKEVFLPPEDEIVREILIRRGVPRDQVKVVDEECLHTEAEAQALKPFLQREPGATATVVTDGFHTRRARWVFRHVLGSDGWRIRFVSAPEDCSLAESWWRTEDGLNAVLGEYLKLVGYLFYYGRAAMWLAAAATLVIAFWLGSLIRRLWTPGTTPTA